MAKIRVQQIAALKSTGKPYKVAADRGLMLRVAAQGNEKRWIVQYVVDGRQRDYPLPKPWGMDSDDAHISLADACLEAARIRALARQGIDYRVQQEQHRAAEAKRQLEEQAAEEARQRKAQEENLTVSNLFEAWVTDGVRRKDNNAELRRSFLKEVLPSLGGKLIRDLTEHDLRSVLRAIVARGVNRTAVVMRNNLAQMFAWAEKRQPWRKLLVDGNPMDLIEIEKIVTAGYDLNNQRDRILSAYEISELSNVFKRMQEEYDCAPNKRVAVQPIEKTVQIAIWIMLSTLCRVGELSMARWEHVDFDTATWFIPKENVKGNFSDLTVYLSDFTLDQFRQLRKVTGESEWCFPAKNKKGHVCVKSMSKQIGDRQSVFKKNKDGTPRKPMMHRRHDDTLVLCSGKNGAWSPHDLRRTGATMMQSLGVPLDIIDRCQNHVLQGSKVRRHYLHHDYREEKKEAWQLLGDRIALILSTSNVLPFQRTA